MNRVILLTPYIYMTTLPHLALERAGHRLSLRVHRFFCTRKQETMGILFISGLWPSSCTRTYASSARDLAPCRKPPSIEFKRFRNGSLCTPRSAIGATPSGDSPMFLIAIVVCHGGGTSHKIAQDDIRFLMRT